MAGVPPNWQQQQQQQQPPPQQQPAWAQQQAPSGALPPGGAPPPQPPQQQQWAPAPSNWNAGPTQRHGSVGNGADGAQQGAAGGGGGMGGMASGVADSFQQEMSKHNPMAGYAVGYGRSLLQGHITRFLPGFDALYGSLKYYFHVDNRFLTSKLRKLLLPDPRAHIDTWRRHEPPMQDGPPPPPSIDVNAPDMYLPLMAFVTYAIIVAFVMGTSGEFTPEVMYVIIQSCTAYLVLEVLAARAAFFLLDISIALFDLVALSAYKYVGLVINMLCGYFFGLTAYYLCLLWTGLAMSLFMIKTLSAVRCTNESADKKRRKLVLLAIGASQLVLMWWLGYSGNLSRGAEATAKAQIAAAAAAKGAAPAAAAAAAAAAGAAGAGAGSGAAATTAAAAAAAAAGAASGVKAA